VLVLQKLVTFEHRKLGYVNVESSVTRNVCKRSLIQTLRRYKFNNRLEEIVLGSQGKVNQTTSCQHQLSKILVQHIGEV